MVSVLFMVFAAVVMAGMLWYLRRIISQFRYDGAVIEFRTVGRRTRQSVPLAEIKFIRE